MADTYTTNLNLTKPEPGAAEDTWGISLNADLDSLDAIFSSSGTQINLNPNQINFADGKKAVFGTGSDLEIYHDGSNSYIKDVGTGSLILEGTTSTQIKGSTYVILRSNAGENMLIANANGSVDSYYDGVKKLATTSTGIDVTGTVTSDGLTVASGSTGLLTTYTGSSSARPLKVSNYDGDFSGSAYSINAESAGGEITLQTATKDRIKVASGGDISFYDDTGTTQGLFWDASAETLAIGHTSPSSTYRLDIAGSIRSFGNAPSLTLREDDASNQTWLMASYGGTFAVRDTTVSGTAYPFQIEAATPNNTLYLDSTGKIGIGTSSPDTLLELFADNPVLRLRDSKVKGSSWAAGDALGGLEFYTSDTTGIGTHTVASITAVNGGQSTSSPDGEIVFSTGAYNTAASEVMRIDSSGRVGIGTTSPSSTLHIKSGTENSSVARFEGFNPNRGLEISTGADATVNDVFVHYNQMLAGYGGHKFDVGDSTLMTIDHSGNIGIGTDSPARALDVSKSGSTILANFKNTGGTSSFITLGNTTSTADQIRVGSNGTALTFSTNYAEVGRFSSNGYFGIGTSSPSSILHVSSDSTPTIKVTDTTNDVTGTFYANNFDSYLTSTSRLIFSSGWKYCSYYFSFTKMLA